mgnify:FL=1
MNIKDAAQVFSDIVEKMNEVSINSSRIIHRMEIGQVVRQGDIYIHRVGDSHECGKKLESRQLAIGNTMGSRHVAEAPATIYEGATLPRWCDARTFIGPCVESAKRFVVTHPEHAHVELPPGRYQITHQMDARTMDRVQD